MNQLFADTDEAAAEIAQRVRSLMRQEANSQTRAAANSEASERLSEKEILLRLKTLKSLWHFLERGEVKGSTGKNNQPHQGSVDDLVLILSGCSWASCGGGQRPVHLARSMARLGQRVVYHCIGDSASFEQHGVAVAGQDMFEFVLGKIEPLCGLCIVTLSTYLAQAERLKAAGWKVCYDLLDDWEAFAKHGDLNPDLLNNESKLIKLADIVTCSAVSLMRRARLLGASKIVLIPNGGLDKPVTPKRQPRDMLMGEVTLVYAGYLYGSWFDWEALLRVVDKRPAWAINVIGKYTNVPERANIRWLGEKPTRKS